MPHARPPAPPPSSAAATIGVDDRARLDGPAQCLGGSGHGKGGRAIRALHDLAWHRFLLCLGSLQRPCHGHLPCLHDLLPYLHDLRCLLRLCLRDSAPIQPHLPCCTTGPPNSRSSSMSGSDILLTSYKI
jgi:hypothetical protein